MRGLNVEKEVEIPLEGTKKEKWSSRNYCTSMIADFIITKIRKMKFASP